MDSREQGTWVIAMPKYTLQYVCGHPCEEDIDEGHIDAVRKQAAKMVCQTCWRANQDQITADMDWLLPPLEGTEKQVAWATQLRAKAVIELLEAKTAYRFDGIMSLVLEDFHKEAIKQSLATWWIDNRNTHIMDLVAEYHSTRRSYYRFVLEGGAKREAAAIIKEAQDIGQDPLDIDAEQALLGAILRNDKAYYGASFLAPEHFCEELHRRIFEVARDLMTANKVASPETLAIFLGNQDLGGVTPRQYMDLLVEMAPPAVDVRRLAVRIYALAELRSQVPPEALGAMAIAPA